jgi:hypothetical protein
VLLVDLGGDWDGRVDGVADDTDDGVGGGLGAGSGELGDDGGVGVETEELLDIVVNDGNLQIVSGHAWLSWDTGGDENDISALDGFLHGGGVRADESGDSGLKSGLIFDDQSSLTLVSMWERSAATPGVTGLTSKQATLVTELLHLRRRASGCPIPPAAPRTATFLLTWVVVERARAVARENILKGGKFLITAADSWKANLDVMNDLKDDPAFDTHRVE